MAEDTVANGVPFIGNLMQSKCAETVRKIMREKDVSTEEIEALEDEGKAVENTMLATISGIELVNKSMLSMLESENFESLGTTSHCLELLLDVLRETRIIQADYIFGITEHYKRLSTG